MEEQFSVQCRRVCEIIDSKCQTHSKNNCFYILRMQQYIGWHIWHQAGQVHFGHS